MSHLTQRQVPVLGRVFGLEQEPVVPPALPVQN
jgi:hypothetical protein